MRSFVSTIPLFLPGIVLTLGIAVVASPAIARRLRASPAISFLLIASIGLIVSATLTPDLPALAAGIPSDGVCDLARVGPPSASELVSLNTTSLNVILFVPLGIAIGLLPISGRSALVGLAAFAVPFAVEGIQLTATALGRGCQSQDVIDNTLGLLVGLALAAAIRNLGRSRSRS